MEQASENERATLVTRLYKQLLVLHTLYFASQSSTLLEFGTWLFHSFAFLTLFFLDFWYELEEARFGLALHPDLNILSNLYALVRICHVIIVEVLQQAYADSMPLLRPFDRGDHVRLLIQLYGRLALSALLEDLLLRLSVCNQLLTEINNAFDRVNVEHNALHLLANFVVPLVG